MMLAKCAASRKPSEDGAVAVPTPEDRFDDAPDVFTEEDLLSDESIFIVVVVRRGRDGRDSSITINSYYAPSTTSLPLLLR